MFSSAVEIQRKGVLLKRDIDKRPHARALTVALFYFVSFLFLLDECSPLFVLVGSCVVHTQKVGLGTRGGGAGALDDDGGVAVTGLRQWPLDPVVRDST